MRISGPGPAEYAPSSRATGRSGTSQTSASVPGPQPMSSTGAQPAYGVGEDVHRGAEPWVGADVTDARRGHHVHVVSGHAVVGIANDIEAGRLRHRREYMAADLGHADCVAATCRRPRQAADRGLAIARVERACTKAIRAVGRPLRTLPSSAKSGFWGSRASVRARRRSLMCVGVERRVAFHATCGWLMWLGV